jgi:hypothetical protein
MNPNDLANNIEDVIIKANDKYGARINAIQSQLFSSLVNQLKDIETDKDGYILQNAKNRAIIIEAEILIDDALSGSYGNAIKEQISIIPKIDDLNNSYFSSLSDTFIENRNFIKSLQNQTIKNIESNLFPDGLQFQVKQPLIDIMNQNVNSGGSFSGFLEQLRTFIKGNDELDGRLMSYSRGLLRDTLFNYSRAYQQSITSDLGLEWYLYSGGLIDHSREFCIERAGNFYHQSEIEDWASLDWQGKNNQTTKSSIFIFAGGWNCSHSIIPVSTIIVPQSDLERIK